MDGGMNDRDLERLLGFLFFAGLLTAVIWAIAALVVIVGVRVGLLA